MSNLKEYFLDENYTNPTLNEDGENQEDGSLS